MLEIFKKIVRAIEEDGETITKKKNTFTKLRNSFDLYYNTGARVVCVCVFLLCLFLGSLDLKRER